MPAQSTTVFMLSAAAMALPGVSYGRDQPTGVRVDIQTSLYEEGDQSLSDIAVGDDDRYDIDIYQFTVATPVAESWSLTFKGTRELMSGASPWGTSADADGAPILIMSGATIDDQRTELGLRLTRYSSNRSYAVALEHSREDDYEALGVSIDGEIDLNRSHSLLGYGVSYSSDTIEPTDALIYGRVTREHKRSHSAFLSFTQVLSRTSQLQMGFSYTQYEGFLSDPYKLRDIRPDERQQLTLSTRYRHYFEDLAAALHLDYRFYRDDYDVEAHTLELAWHQNFGEAFSMTPSLRYYGQAEAGFYLPIDDYNLTDSISQSSDYRLSTYGALTFGLKAEYRHQATSNWRIRLSVDQYQSDADYSYRNAEVAHPALIDFTMISLGLTWRL